MSDELTTFVGCIADRFVTTQYFGSGGAATDVTSPINQLLYEAALEESGDETLTGSAGLALADAVDPGDVVFIATGFIVPPWNRTEADGPMGAPGLARALALSLEARPIVVTERANVEAVESMLGASGLPVVEPERVAEGHRKVGVTTMPIDEDREEARAEELLEEYDPSGIIAVEKPSRNVAGVQHNGAGYDISGTTAGADVLIDRARERGVVTVGIGDGGNEIGMGRIEDQVHQIIPATENCQCPCDSGIASATETDHLIVAATANWGGYGLAACLAALAEDPNVMHDRQIEKRIQETTARAGVVDPMTGLAEGWLDGMPPKVGLNVVDQLRTMVELQITHPWQLEQAQDWSGREDVLRSAIDRHGEYLLANDR